MPPACPLFDAARLLLRPPPPSSQQPYPATCSSCVAGQPTSPASILADCHGAGRNLRRFDRPSPLGRPPAVSPAATSTSVPCSLPLPCGNRSSVAAVNHHRSAGDTAVPTLLLLRSSSLAALHA
ncbi:hypothetical protein NL676_007347 [Syzygium grande]|nr:hypothetical protein NL676_007347 [Syzygium grande]